MKRKYLAALCIASASVITAQNAYNSAYADGYLCRGICMYETENFIGCIDQLNQLLLTNPDEEVRAEAEYYKAMALFRNGDKEALGALKTYLDCYPSSPRRHEVRFAIGSWYFYHDQYVSAVTEFDTLSSDAFDNATAADLCYRRAFCHIRTGDYDTAERDLLRLRGVKRYADQSAYYMAVIQYSRGNYSEARRGFESINKRSDLHNEARFYICHIDFADGKYATVKSEAESILKGSLPENMRLEMLRISGESNYHLGYYDNAVSLLKEYADNADDAQRTALYALGVSEFNTGNYSDAKNHLGQVTLADDELAQSAYLYVGQAYLHEENVKAASMAFKKAYKMPYDREVKETAFYNYAIAQSQGGRTPFNSSVKLFQDFLNTFPSSHYADKVEDYIINSYLNNKDYDNALASINALKSPSQKMLRAKQNVLYRLGMREMSANRNNVAINYLSQAEALARYDKATASEVNLWLAEAHYREGQYAKAESLYAKYSGNANRGKALFGQAYAQYRQRKYSSAYTQYEKALASKQLDATLCADAYNRMADCQYYQSRFAEAESLYNKAFKMGTSKCDYSLYQIGMMRGYQGNHTNKISTLDELVASYPDSPYAPKALYQRGQAYQDLGKNAKAVDAFKKLISSYPTTAESRQGQLQLALLLNSMGKTDESREQYEALVKAYPTSDEAKVAVDDLKRIYAAEGRLDDLSAFLRSVGNYNIDDNEMAQLAFDAAENEYLDRGKTDKLKSFVAKYPSLRPAALANYYLAEASVAEGNETAALTYVDKALQLAPDGSFAESALAMKGDLLLNKGDYATARECFALLESKTTITSNVNRARLGLLRSAVALNDYDAMQQYASLLLNSESLSEEITAEARYARAVAAMQKGDTTTGVTDFNTLIDSNINNLYGSKAAVDLGTYYYNAGNLKKAEATVNKLIDSSSPHHYWMARAFILLSDIFKKQGDTFQAREYLESLQANYPGNEEDIKQMIDERLKALK